MINKISPCMGCTRVKDPRQCENKQCQLWQRWFLQRWKETCSTFLEQFHAPALQRKQPENPCNTCVLGEKKCEIPCSGRRNWDALRKDVFL